MRAEDHGVRFTRQSSWEDMGMRPGLRLTASPAMAGPIRRFEHALDLTSVSSSSNVNNKDFDELGGYKSLELLWFDKEHFLFLRQVFLPQICLQRSLRVS